MRKAINCLATCVLVVLVVPVCSLNAGLIPPSQDTALMLTNPTTNYGSAAGTTAGFYTAPGQEERSLLQYDLSAYAGYTVNSATLYMYRYYKYSSGTLSADVHRVTVPWLEGEATWNSAKTGVTWSQAGGDYDPTVIANNVLPSTTINAWFSWDITDLVQDWVDGTYDNEGLLVKQTSFAGYTYSAFYSKEYGSNASYIDLDAIPEPGTMLLLGTGSLLLLRRKRAARKATRSE